jgi:hypothetical protein
MSGANSEWKQRLFARYQASLARRKERQYFTFRHLLPLFIYFSSVYVVWCAPYCSDPLALWPTGALTVRIAAKCFTTLLPRSFPLYLLR